VLSWVSAYPIFPGVLYRPKVSLNLAVVVVVVALAGELLLNEAG
jgi:hypothetical protein